MCGIAGFVNYKRVFKDEDRQVLFNMGEALNRRGPDDKGDYVADCLGLTHRRLAVIDPENGRQPMVKLINNNTYVICYNGELYNTEEIRTELRLLGYEFDGRSDTEVLLTA